VATLAEHDVLNADVSWRATIQDSIGPDYGWNRTRPSTLAVTKPAAGQPWSRETGNGGHTHSFSWLRRSGACVRLLKQWAEQHEQGFFTIIDQDGGGRHYVGNFVGDMPLSEAGNDTWNIQGWSFVEIPGCPMLQYPSNWDDDAVSLKSFNDYSDQFAATSAGWVRVPAVVGDDGVSRQPKQMIYQGATLGAWLTMEYRGYGFRLWMVQGPGQGKIQVQIDGVTYVDATTAQDGTIDLGGDAATVDIALTVTNLPLDIHRVTVLVTGGMAVSGGNSVSTYTQIAGINGVITVQVANQYKAGDQVVIPATETFQGLNGVPLTVLADGLSATQFKASVLGIPNNVIVGPALVTTPPSETGEVVLIETTEIAVTFDRLEVMR
jgi:hypothetical protein